MDRPSLKITTVNLGAPDALALARFYEQLLGWPIAHQEDGFVIVRDPDGGVGVSFQHEKDYVRPVWPARPDAQQMQMHLEIMVDDLAASVAFAEQCGATLAEFQPQDNVRVCLDPAGHPFCLFLNSSAG